MDDVGGDHAQKDDGRRQHVQLHAAFLERREEAGSYLQADRVDEQNQPELFDEMDQMLVELHPEMAERDSDEKNPRHAEPDSADFELAERDAERDRRRESAPSGRRLRPERAVAEKKIMKPFHIKKCTDRLSSLVRIRVACRRGRRCGRQGLPRFRLRRYEIIRNLRMPDRARSAFLLKNLKYLGRVRFDPGPRPPGGVCRREGYGLCRFGCFAPFVSRCGVPFFASFERGRNWFHRSDSARRGSDPVVSVLAGGASALRPEPRCQKADRAPYGCRPDKKSRPVVGNPD